MHEVLVNRLGSLSLPRKSVVRLTDRPDMTLDVYRGRKTTIQQQQLNGVIGLNPDHCFIHYALWLSGLSLRLRYKRWGGDILNRTSRIKHYMTDRWFVLEVYYFFNGRSVTVI